MRKNTLFLIIYIIFGYACHSDEDPSIVKSYSIISDHELVKDTFLHENSYTFQLQNNLSQISNQKGKWSVQLQKKDGAYLTIFENTDQVKFNIESNSLINLIPVTENFNYDGIRIIGRIIFASEDNSFSVEKRIIILGKPAKPIFRIKEARNNGYPNEKDITFEFVCDGASRYELSYCELPYGTINIIECTGDNTLTLKYIEMTVVNEFKIYATNQLGTTMSDIIYFGGH